MKIQTNSLRFRSFLILLSVFTGFFLFELLIVYPAMLKRSVVGAHLELQGVCQGLARGTDSVFGRARDELIAVANLPDLKRPQPGDPGKALEIMTGVSQFYNYVTLADTRGIFTVHPADREREGEPLPPEDMAAFRHVKETGNSVFLEPRIDPAGYLLSGFAVPVADDDDRITGVLLGYFILNEYKSNSVVVNNSRIGQSGHVYMTARNGWLLASPQEPVDYQNYEPLDYSNYPPVISALEGESGLAEYTYKGVPWTAWYTQIPITGWVMVAQRPTRDIRSVAVKATVGTLIIFSITFFLSGILIFLLIGHSLKPLRLLIQSVSAGLPVTDLAVKPDEIGHLAQIFGQLYTDLKEAKEKAEENDRLKTAFLANISHEIRTPMNGIMGFTELLRDPATWDRDRDRFLDIIRESGQRMLNILSDLIDISRIESGQINIQLRDVDIAPLLIHLHGAFFPEADRKNLDLILSGCPQPREQILNTDETKLTQILSNLLKNAIKFTPTGTVEIRYERTQKVHRFSVLDTGPGIPAPYQEVVFERFRQVDPSGTYSSDGAGLGLAISRAFATRLGGSLTVESEAGKGSVFTLTIPAGNSI